MTHGSIGRQGWTGLETIYSDLCAWNKHSNLAVTELLPTWQLHCQSPQRSSKTTRATSGYVHPRFSTLREVVTQPTTVPSNLRMPTPEPHYYEWGPGVQRHSRVRDLYGVLLGSHSFSLIGALGLKRVGFHVGLSLWSECWASTFFFISYSHWTMAS